MDNPTAAVLKTSSTIIPLGNNEPVSQVNKFGYNPALERRLNYKAVETICDKSTPGLKRMINVNYLIVDPVYETAYRSDVKRVETTNKMAIKATEDFAREEEFCNVTTSYRDARAIMLAKKFETFFSAKLNDEQSASE